MTRKRVTDEQLTDAIQFIYGRENVSRQSWGDKTVEGVVLNKVQRLCSVSTLAKRYTASNISNKISKTTFKRIVRLVTCGQRKLLAGLDIKSERYGQLTCADLKEIVVEAAKQQRSSTAESVDVDSMHERVDLVLLYLKRDYIRELTYPDANRTKPLHCMLCMNRLLSPLVGSGGASKGGNSQRGTSRSSSSGGGSSKSSGALRAVA